MKLSAEQFAELTASFNSQSSASNHERRRATRLDLQARIKIRPVAGEMRLDPMYVMCSNFSSRGLSFIHGSTMENGRQFITELPRKSGGIVELLCTVVHCETLGHNAYRIGGEFTCVIPMPPQTKSAGDADEVARIRASMME